MPFKRPDSKYFATELVLPGYGKLRRVSLGTPRAADARAIEGAIRELHRRGLHEPRLFAVLDALQGRGPGRPGAVTPADVLVAVRAPDGAEAGLGRLLRRLDDPKLADLAAERLALATTSREERTSLPVILAHAAALWGPEPRLSALLEPGAVQRLLDRILAETGRLPGSVVRYEKQTLAKLLEERLGRFERDRVMKEVRFAGGDDRRRIRTSIVTPEAVARLCDELAAGYWQEGDEAAPLFVRIAATTGAEVSAVARARNADWQPEGSGAGVLFLSGTKRAKAGKVARDRDVRLPRSVAAEVNRHHRAELATAPLFPLAIGRFRTMFDRARERAGLMEAVLDGRNKPVPMRPHDLRRVYAHFARLAGVSREAVGLAGLGHSRLEQTDEYTRAQIEVSAAEADAIAATLGL